MFFFAYPYLFLSFISKFLLATLIICCLPSFHLYRTNIELAHCEFILIKLNISCIEKNIQITIENTHGIILRFLLFKSLSINNASVIILREIKTVQYHKIADQIIHHIHRQMIVVNEMFVNKLSFLIIAYGRETINNIYTIIRINHISV